MTAECTVLLTSAGRRPYLVRWFKEAFELNGVVGRVILADSDAMAPARALADAFVEAPLAREPAYAEWLTKTIEHYGVDVALSVNDFEISQWSRLGATPTLAALVRTTEAVQDHIEDKVRMAAVLQEHKVSVPRLERPSRALSYPDGSANADERIVVKGRFGSASRGLRLTDRRRLASVMPGALAEVTDRDGRAANPGGDPDETLIVQDFIDGDEYGLDVVCDLSGKYATVLARKKLAMRNGETDRAISVDAAPFEQLGQQLASALPHHGVFDVDVIVDSSGVIWVIDVNPRFGGGYPFSHTAGAHVPAAYVAWALGGSAKPEWLASEPGVISGKSVEVLRIQ